MGMDDGTTQSRVSRFYYEGRSARRPPSTILSGAGLPFLRGFCSHTSTGMVKQ